MKKVFLIAFLAISITSCENENNLNLESQIQGIWELNQLIKFNQNGALEIENLSDFSIDFDISNTVFINRSFEIHAIGNYDFVISSENYFDPENIADATSEIIEFDGARYAIELGSNENGNRSLKLISFDGTKKELHFKEK